MPKLLLRLAAGGQQGGGEVQVLPAQRNRRGQGPPPRPRSNWARSVVPTGSPGTQMLIRPRRRRRLSTLVPGRSPPPQDHGQDRVELCRPGAYGPEA